MSWEWQSTWWRVFSNHKSMSLSLLVAHDENGALVGIAPLYLATVNIRKIVNVTRLQFIGNIWRGEATMPTEYIDFILLKSVEQEVLKCFVDYITNNIKWDDFVIPYLQENSVTSNYLLSPNVINHCLYRIAEKYLSYPLRLSNSLSTYKKNLGKHTRLKLFNRRKRLAALGTVIFQYDFNATEVKKLFQLLNELHSLRWGKNVFDGRRMEFNYRLAQLMHASHCLRFSVIKCDQQPISIQYNYLVNGHMYNIQAGFDPNFDKKIPLGYLHFGYEIEYAFSHDLTEYDFLVGEGKNISYKEGLTDHRLEIIDLQIIRNKYLCFLYSIYDWVTRFMKFK